MTPLVRLSACSGESVLNSGSYPLSSVVTSKEGSVRSRGIVDPAASTLVSPVLPSERPR
ncbi:Uncharacterised protein [Mycobacteroides abscessus]|nr:Uncharacterised protein [Mycobacteroides abscessus]